MKIILIVATLLPLLSFAKKLCENYFDSHKDSIVLEGLSSPEDVGEYHQSLWRENRGHSRRNTSPLLSPQGSLLKNNQSVIANSTSSNTPSQDNSISAEESYNFNDKDDDYEVHDIGDVDYGFNFPSHFLTQESPRESNISKVVYSSDGHKKAILSGNTLQIDNLRTGRSYNFTSSRKVDGRFSKSGLVWIIIEKNIDRPRVRLWRYSRNSNNLMDIYLDHFLDPTTQVRINEYKDHLNSHEFIQIIYEGIVKGKETPLMVVIDATAGEITFKGPYDSSMDESLEEASEVND